MDLADGCISKLQSSGLLDGTLDRLTVPGALYLWRTIEDVVREAIGIATRAEAGECAKSACAFCARGAGRRLGGDGLWMHDGVADNHAFVLPCPASAIWDRANRAKVWP